MTEPSPTTGEVTPGSGEARFHGCTCDRRTNGWGVFKPLRGWRINPDCPIHGSKHV